MIYTAIELRKYTKETKDGNKYYVYQDSDTHPYILLPCPTNAPQILKPGLHKGLTLGLTKAGNPRINSNVNSELYFIEESGYDGAMQYLSKDQLTDFKASVHQRKGYMGEGYCLNITGSILYSPKQMSIISDINNNLEIIGPDKLIDFLINDNGKTFSYEVDKNGLKIKNSDGKTFAELSIKDIPIDASLLKLSVDNSFIMNLAIKNKNFIKNNPNIDAFLSKLSEKELLNIINGLDFDYDMKDEKTQLTDYILKNYNFSDAFKKENLLNIYSSIYNSYTNIEIPQTPNLDFLYKKENLDFLITNTPDNFIQIAQKFGVNIKEMIKDQESRTIIEEALKNNVYKTNDGGYETYLSYNTLDAIYKDFSEKEKLFLMLETQRDALPALLPNKNYILTDDEQLKAISLAPNMLYHIDKSCLKEETMLAALDKMSNLNDIKKLLREEELPAKVQNKLYDLCGIGSIRAISRFEYDISLKNHILDNRELVTFFENSYWNKRDELITQDDTIFLVFQPDGFEGLDFFKKYIKELNEVQNDRYLVDRMGSHYYINRDEIICNIWNNCQDKDGCYDYFSNLGVVSLSTTPIEHLTNETLLKYLSNPDNSINEEDYKEYFRQSPNFKITPETALTLSLQKDWYYDTYIDNDIQKDPNFLKTVAINPLFLINKNLRLDTDSKDLQNAIKNTKLKELSFQKLRLLPDKLREAYLENPLHSVICSTNEEREDFENLKAKAPVNLTLPQRIKGATGICIPYVISKDGNIHLPEQFEFNNHNHYHHFVINNQYDEIKAKQEADGTGTWNQIGKDEVVVSFSRSDQKSHMLVDIDYVPSDLSKEQEETIKKIVENLEKENGKICKGKFVCSDKPLDNPYPYRNNEEDKEIDVLGSIKGEIIFKNTYMDLKNSQPKNNVIVSDLIKNTTNFNHETENSTIERL